MRLLKKFHKTFYLMPQKIKFYDFVKIVKIKIKTMKKYIKKYYFKHLFEWLKNKKFIVF